MNTGQRIIHCIDSIEELDSFFNENNIINLFVVCGSSSRRLTARRYLEDRFVDGLVIFSDFSPNPTEESVLIGLDTFNSCNPDIIIAVGGGSAMDVAKCIRLKSGKKKPLLVIPTTAGSGSEATQFAVVYRNGEKVSIDDPELLPDIVVMWPDLLKSLPIYQRKSTMLDALCHAVESSWSVHSTDESRKTAMKAIYKVLENKDGYLSNEDTGNAGMLEAAHLAGQAINITRTTAGHAMCYKLTTLYGLAHGHAAALCTAALWNYMEDHLSDCVDPRGVQHLAGVMRELDHAFGEGGLQGFIRELGMERPHPDNVNELEEIVDKVNIQRLSNHPVKLSRDVIRNLYKEIMEISG